MLFKKAHRFVTLVIFMFYAAFTSAQQQPSLQPVRPGANNIPAIDTLPAADSSRTDPFLATLLDQYPQYFKQITTRSAELNVQVIYTTIDRGANGIAALKHFYFNENPRRYFYPANTVALPAAMLTLQRLNELRSTGVNKNSTMLTEAGYSGQTAVYNDPTTDDGKPAIGHYLEKMLVANDEDGFNRLYEFLGQQYINQQLAEKGYPAACITERLGLVLTDDQNRHTNPVKFLDPAGKLLYGQPMQVSSSACPQRKDSLGTRGNSAGTPVDFSFRNRLSLQDLHNLLISLVFPNKVTASQRFNVPDEDRKCLLKCMGQLPGETIYPSYGDDTAQYYPAYRKFLFCGAEKGELPAGMRFFNVSGNGYGNITDVAYIVDLDRKIEFFLSAVIYCNSDGNPGNDGYDYETVGFPFMKNLGRVIYQYETKREKKIIPDLSGLQFDYRGN